jgi:hypothetical protein
MREDQISRIRKQDADFKSAQTGQEGLLTSAANEFSKLRHHSIRVVELIVLWRD